MREDLTDEQIAAQNQVLDRLRKLQPGESYVYCASTGRSSESMPIRVMELAYTLYLQGKLHLLQRPHGPPLPPGQCRGCDYIAIARHPPYQPIPQRERS
jgi:hypothetical protein